MRKITFKTITQQSFELEFEDEQTVEEMKQKISREKGDSFPVEGQKLIYNGKLLEDKVKVADLNIADGKFIVIMATKQKKDVPAPVPASEAKKSETSTTAATPSSQASNTAVSANTTVSTEVPPEHEQKVTDIQAMGYPKEEVIRALRASFYNTERAVEYLCNGIPEGLNLGVPEVEAENAPGDVEQGEAAGDHDDLTFLQDSPQFQQLRDIVRTNPAMLPQIIQQIATTNPELMNTISNNQAAFLELLNAQAAAGGEGGAGAAGQPAGQPAPVTIPITPEDRAALERLQAMGFPEQLVIEAYFACDRQEDLAVNYIIERLDEFHDQGGEQ